MNETPDPQPAIASKQQNMSAPLTVNSLSSFAFQLLSFVSQAGIATEYAAFLDVDYLNLFQCGTFRYFERTVVSQLALNIEIMGAS
jgi:hypothetical protein